MTSYARICSNCAFGQIKPQDKFCTSCGAEFPVEVQVQLDDASSDKISEPRSEDRESPTGPRNIKVETTTGPGVQLAKALRRFLPGGQKVSEEEREEVLSYFNENASVISLQSREAGNYNSTLLVHMNQLDKSESVDTLLAASEKLLICADECFLRHGSLSPIPDRALPSYSAWEATFDVYLQWARATRDAFLAVSKDETPSSETVQNLFSEQETRRNIAYREDSRILRAFGLSVDDLGEIVDGEGESTETVQLEPDPKVGDIG